MEDILKQILDKITNVENIQISMQNDIAEMQNDITGMKGDITGMKGDITGMKGDITGMKGDITGMKGDISKLKDGQEELNIRVSRLETDMKYVKDGITALCSDVAMLDERTVELKKF